MDKIDLENVNCNLCEGSNARFLYKKPDTRFWIHPMEFNIVQCKNCGLAFVNPRPTLGSMRFFYPDNFYTKRDIDYEKERFLKQIDLLEKYKQGKKILDIGCGGGGFIKLLKDKGWDVYGMDFYAQSGNRYNLNIQYGDLLRLKYPSRYFDAVTSWAVFEHLHDPMKYFKEVFRILKENGIFICLVTNLNSLWSRWAYGEDVPRHLYFFSPKTLKRYAMESGFILKKFDYSNSFLKASSKSVFKFRVLRSLGFAWRDICFGQTNIPFKMLSKILSAGGHVLFNYRTEAFLKIPGIIIGIFEKK